MGPLFSGMANFSLISIWGSMMSYLHNSCEAGRHKAMVSEQITLFSNPLIAADPISVINPNEAPCSSIKSGML